MPQAPLSPTVDGSGSGLPEVGVAAPVEAFGGAVGHALSGLGTAVEGAADKIWPRAVELQNLENETQAKRADTEYMTKAGMLHADFSALEGTAARDAFPKYIKDLQEARVSLRGTLTNPMAQKMYDGSSTNFMGRSIFNGAGHAAQQTKVASVNASKSRVQTLTDSIGDNPRDDDGVARSMRAITVEIQSQGVQGGWSQDQIKATTDSTISSAVATRITSLTRTDPFAAQRMYDTALEQKALNPVDASKVLSSIQTQSRQVIPRNISQEVNADLDHPTEGAPEKSLEDRIAEAQTKAAPYAKNDPLLPEFVKQRVIADFSRTKAIKRDFDQHNEGIIQQALITGNREGILPKSVDELKLVNPDVSASWDALRPAQQAKFMKSLANNAGDEKVTWNNETLGNYQKLKGMAADDPVEFLAKDIIAEKMPNSAKRELINQQFSLRKQSAADPRVGRAMKILSGDIQAAGIDKRKDPDQYYRFTGALADALDDYQQNNKKVPPAEEVKKMGAHLMQQQITDKGWLWDSKAALFDIPVPDDKAAEIKADPYWSRNDIIPNDNMIRRVHAAQEYKRLYGGTTTTKPKGFFREPSQ